MAGTEQNARVQEALTAVDRAVAEQRISSGGAENLKRWLTQPYYAAYLPVLLEEIDRGNFRELDAKFWEVIPFGTGGRRGEMADYGSATINDRTMAESAQGLADYTWKATGNPEGTAVIAYDTRHRSAEFARLAASTLAGNDFHVFFFESHRSTPELSFAVRHLECDVGAMISASHNPPSDNGFKAYWSNGAQVLPPHDKGIIECVYQVGETPMVPFEEAVRQGKIEIIGEDVDRAYIDAVKSLSLSQAREIRAIFTPLHGVGETSVYRVLREAGFDGVQVFEPQRAPDGAFPNVPDHLPNPERPAVFRPAIEEAQRMGAELVLASDPDADRIGVSVRNSEGVFVHLTGNRIAALLTDYVLRKRQAAGTLSPEHYVVETLVTTPLVAAIGRSYGVRVIDDLLVGFKYIAQTMDREGPERFVFGAEESLGYLAGNYARDKDAAIAALYLMELAAELWADGKTLLDQLDELYLAQGYFLEDQKSEVLHGPQGKAQIDQLMRAFREHPPTELGGIRLARARDYGQHEIRQLPANKRTADLPEPKGDLVFFDSEPGVHELRLAVRPSGTEPKIKFYFFASRQAPSREELEATRTDTELTLQACMADLTRWTKQVLEAS